MRIAIHNSTKGFHPRWIQFCEENNIDYKLVDCYSSGIIKQLKDCQALMWHFQQSNAKDILIAKQILFALEHSGFTVFPNFNTAWHFDDKVAQKYLFEALEIPMVPSWVFFEEKEAMAWVEKASFPKVFKLRGGAGSANVKLVRSSQQAKYLIKKAFGSGFSQYEPWSNLKERFRKYKKGRADLNDVIKGVVRLGLEPNFSKVIGKERGYIYFQAFIPNLDCDYRIMIIHEKAFAIKRFVREKDFRASGSGNLSYDKSNFNKELLEHAFKIAEKIKSDSCILDFIYHNDTPLLVEVSYGFPMTNFADDCPGYWDKNLQWHEGSFNPQGWMVENLIKKLI